ncbi:MAG: phosphoribosylformylglycinamidine synthase subunit PurQ [Verrucomicrobia bacterium]|nr:phosphoribosylformylglycinamidine synthase subunit PurQ [Verrucomicrobiota bacterium]
MKPKILIITGYGVNCEAESKYAWELAGADVDLVHLNDLIENAGRLQDYAGLMFIGGFSYGDHMTSGHVFARRVKHHLQEELQKFIDAERVVLGICNGFQVMTKMGLLPGLNGGYFDPKVALMQNECGCFQNRWVELAFEQTSNCVFTKGLDRMPLPVRHGEGKLFTPDKKIFAEIESAGCVACRYVDGTSGKPTQDFPQNPNGSLNAIAGLTDPTGRVFGMMPHPEAYLFPENHPQWKRQKLEGALPEHGSGLQLFENAVKFLQG